MPRFDAMPGARRTSRFSDGSTSHLGRIGVLALSVGGIGGCATPLARHEAPTTLAAPGAEAVFAPGVPAGDGTPGAEGTRWDASLGVGEADGPLLAVNQWPEPPRDSLERWVRVNVPTNPRSFVFFLPERRWHAVDRRWYRVYRP